MRERQQEEAGRRRGPATPDRTEAPGGRPPREGDESAKYRLTIPLDASGIPDRAEKECCDNEPLPERVELKVAARDAQGNVRSRTVALDADGRGAATIGFETHPGTLQVYVGPGNASDEELANLQTLRFEVSGRQWVDRAELTLPAVVIAPYYWFWWRRWCRTFVIRGRVLCPDGSPVPGAQVCAYDVDRQSGRLHHHEKSPSGIPKGLFP